MTTRTVSRSKPPALTGSLGFLSRAAAWALLFFGAARVPWIQQNLLIPFARAQGVVACGLAGTDPNSVFIGLSCTGADPMALVLASVLAFPVAWRRRLEGAAVGLGLILVLNIARIGTLSVVVQKREIFNLLHVYVWPAVLIVAAAAYVFYWMGRAVTATAGAGHPARPDGSSLNATISRFLGWLLLFVVGFYALSPWLMHSRAVLELARWATHASAAVMSLALIPATVNGNFLHTPHGSWAVTQECIVTPLLPVYLAAVAVLPISGGRRLLAGAAAIPLFLALGSARLLVLAVPAAIVGSHLVAVHAFYQTLLAATLVALAAWLAEGESRLRSRLRRTSKAFALGSVVGLAVGLLFEAALRPALASVSPSLHLGHGFQDPQGALTLLPGFLTGTFTGLWVAQKRDLLTLEFAAPFGLTIVAGALGLVVTGEWATHLTTPPIEATRALSVALPALLLWFLTLLESRRASGLSQSVH